MCHDMYAWGIGRQASLPEPGSGYALTGAGSVSPKWRTGYHTKCGRCGSGKTKEHETALQKSTVVKAADEDVFRLCSLLNMEEN